MLSHLSNLLGLTSRETYPSTVLIIGHPPTTTLALHIVPEDGAAEQVGYQRATAFSCGTAQERSRELLGTVTLHNGDGEGPFKFLDDVSERATAFLARREKTSPEGDSVQAAEKALRYAVLGSVQEKSGRPPLPAWNDPRSYPFHEHAALRTTRPAWCPSDPLHSPSSNMCLKENNANATGKAIDNQDQSFDILTWPTVPDLPRLQGSTILNVGRSFFIYTPNTILELGIDEGEAIMTMLAHNILGDLVPKVSAMVNVAKRSQSKQ